MLIDMIDRHAEQKLLAFIEESKDRNAAQGALHFRCPKTGRKLRPEEIVFTVKPVLQDKQAAIYFLDDGDLIITWSGVQQAVIDDVCKCLYQYFHLTGEEALHYYYDFGAHGEDLRLLVRTKLKSLTDYLQTSKKNIQPPFQLAFTDEQLENIRRFSHERHTYKTPTILIVEDQEFSRKLLQGMLGRTHVCHSAVNAETAVALYAEHIPSIVFLDIELPDANGHDVAAFLKKHDPESFIVMVTANHYEKDVIRARENKVQGFIVKPYSKQKVLDKIEAYKTRT